MVEFFLFIGVLILFALLVDTRGRLQRAEATLAEAAKRSGALQRQAGLLPPKPGEVFPDPQAAPQPQAGPPPAPVPAEPERPSMTEAQMRARWGAKTESVVEDQVSPEPSEEMPRAAALKGPPPAVLVGEPVPDRPPADVGTDAAEGAVVSAEEATPEPLVPPDAGREMTMPEPDMARQDTPPPPTEPPPDPPSVGPPPPPASLASRFENLFGKTLPIWAGGITLAIAGVLIVRYAIDAGFFARIFTRGVQVIAGGTFGLTLIGGAELAWRNEDRVRDPRVPQALSGAGIATLYAAVLVAANAYALISPLTAFILLAVITATALGLSLRFGAPSALLGLAGGLAAPALVGAMEPNVPVLAVYLGLTITGLAGVARIRRWPWLAVAALAGGAGWSLWMVAAGQALDTLGTLSVGGFVLLLAIVLPLLAMDGPRSWLLRSASVVVGALQLALLVTIGGFAPLEWGLFALLASAGQWLAWRDRNFQIVPTISVALSALLLALWPDPGIGMFAGIGLSLAAIHALPLLARLTSVQRALELGGIALAAPLLMRWQFADITDAALGLVALGGAMLAAAGVGRLWRNEERSGDARLAWLSAIAAGLVALALAVVAPLWAVPLAIGASAAALLVVGECAADRRIEQAAIGFVVAACLSLLAAPLVLAEIPHLLFGTEAAISAESLARLGGMTALLVFFGLRVASSGQRSAALALAGGFAYATLAQMVPGWSLPLAMGGVALSCFAIAQWRTARGHEWLAASFAAAALLLLTFTGPQVAAEWSRLASSDLAVDVSAGLRWGGLTALFALLATRATAPALRFLAHAAAGGLAYGLMAQFMPGWALPLAMVSVAAAALLLGERAHTFGVSALAVVFAVASIPVLVVSADSAFAEWSRLWGTDSAVTLLSLLRWSAVAALALLFAVRSRNDIPQRAAQIAAVLLVYGSLAQIVPATWLPLVPAIGVAASLLAIPRVKIAAIGWAGGGFAALMIAWALEPMLAWAAAALPSLIGVPMTVTHPALEVRDLFLRLLLPALLLGGSVWIRRTWLPKRAMQAALALAGPLAGVALHALYRHGFAATLGSDFVAVGLGQRLLWEALLIGGGVVATRRGYPVAGRAWVWAGTVHLFWYSLILHNPLWQAQAVGPLPVLNLIAPLFLLGWLGLRESVRQLPAGWPDPERGVQLVTMALVAGFAWASLRHAFHGSLLVDPGVPSAENILRSILILGLAISFLLWGIAKRQRDWRIASLLLMLAAVAKVFLLDASGLEGLLRIASFVALGFSLIGIGWLYSRQLRSDAAAERPGSAGVSRRPEPESNHAGSA